MKVIDKIKKAEEEAQCYWSFEYFPPKTPQGVLNLYDRMERMYALGPQFVDVTWGAGGTTSDLTLEICQTAQTVYGLETCMHLTCTNMPKEQIDSALKQAKDAGIQNILALRGDPPRGQVNWVACESGFSHAIDLVKYIRKEYGDYFCVSVAGYPEGHIDNADKEADLLHLKEKVDAGADYIVTQLFYDVDLFIDWVEKCRKIGIDCPILPGIMPIQSYGGFRRMTSLCKTFVPKYVDDELEPIKDDDQAVKDYGVRLAADMCRKLKTHGIRGFHFYTLNLEKSARLILEELNFVPRVEETKPLPWNQSYAKNRSKENVRPVFWRNRTRAYIQRTETWDEFPNGRWGDSRSPAYGELDRYGLTVKYSKQETLALWNTPKTLDELQEVFAGYCSGKVNALPWCEQPLSGESNVIRDKLVKLNHRGLLTINSQPAVNGEPSSHAVFGWGPKNGYVYQKAYLEFFVSPELLTKLLEKLRAHPTVTFYAVSISGDLISNTETEGEPNAVTWGVFPGKEIVQPTVVEQMSFLAWKDEAFALWAEWERMFADETETQSLLHSVANTYFLMNVVENDYINGDIWSIFEGLEA